MEPRSRLIRGAGGGIFRRGPGGKSQQANADWLQHLQCESFHESALRVVTVTAAQNIPRFGTKSKHLSSGPRNMVEYPLPQCQAYPTLEDELKFLRAIPLISLNIPGEFHQKPSPEVRQLSDNLFVESGSFKAVHNGVADSKCTPGNIKIVTRDYS